MSPTITQAERDAIVTREEALRAYLKQNKLNSYRPEEVAHLNPPTNEERSAVEVFDFIQDKPDRYTLYIRDDRAIQGERFADGVATTWMGDILGHVAFGKPYRSNMGDTRVPVWVMAINGCNYQGTYYKSAGDYARIRKVKGGNHA